MTDIQQMALIGFGSINAIMFALPPTFIFCVVRFPGFRVWVMDLIEDGDKKPNKADAKDALILFFAYVFVWGIMNIVGIWIYGGKDMLAMFIAVSGTLLTMLGLNKIGEAK